MSNLVVYNKDLVNNTGITLSNPIGDSGTYELSYQAGGSTYYLHNFETEEPDYLFDMVDPDNWYFYNNGVLDSDAKFGNYSYALDWDDFGYYYGPDVEKMFESELYPPITFEFWFKIPYLETGRFAEEICLYAWDRIDDSWYNTYFSFYFGRSYDGILCLEAYIYDKYDNTILDNETLPLPFTFDEYHFCAIVILSDRIKVFFDGILYNEFVSPKNDGFYAQQQEFYFCTSRCVGRIDAFKISGYQKYFENFDPPTEPPNKSGIPGNLTWGNGESTEISEDGTYTLFSLENVPQCSIDATIVFSELANGFNTDLVRVEEKFPDNTGLINISKPSEYLLNSITINSPTTKIVGDLYVNNFYCDGPIGENNIVTGNGTEWNLISNDETISLTNTTLSDSNASGGSQFIALISNGCVDSGGNAGWIFYTEVNSSVFLKFNNIPIEKGTRLLPESILLTLNLSSIITELTENTIKIYINEISNVISAPTTIKEFNALVLSEPILYQTNLQRKNLTSMHIDITELIKKVINLENWSSGNSIMLVLKNDDPFFLKFFDFSENADKAAMISKTDVTTTSNIETGIITSSNTVLVSEETRTVVIPSGYVIGDYVFIVGNHIIGKAPNPVPSADYYFIHNFETAVNQPDYVWDMEEPDDYELDCGGSSLTSDAKFGNYGLQLAKFKVYYAPDAPDNLDFDTPYTLEYWFKIPAPSPPTSIDAYFNLAWGNTWSDGVYQLLLYCGNWRPGVPMQFKRYITDIDDNELVDDATTTIPFSYSEWHHFAMVLTDNKLRYYFDGIKQDEFTSPSPTGFKGRLSKSGTYGNTWEFIDTSNYSDSPGGLEVIIDAWSVTRSEKYTENFTPPTEPPGV